MESARQNKELIDATRPFAVESKLKSFDEFHEKYGKYIISAMEN